MRNKLKELKGRKLWPSVLRPQRSPNPPSAGNDPTQTGSAARWPVAVCREVGMVCSYRCVCVWEALVCVGLPLVVLLHHCFSSLGQETAVESEAEVKVCTQPFEGYSVLPANINQVAWSWAFTELENHIMLAHSHRRRRHLAVNHAGWYMATLMKVDLVIIDSVLGFLEYFLSQ